MKKIIILGSTGSIGTQSLDIVRNNPDKFTCSALCCGRNVGRLRVQIDEFNPKAVSVLLAEDAKKLREEYPDIEVYFGEDGINRIASFEGDMVVNALVGILGLVPTIMAINSGKDVALANKETLVAGGDIPIKLAKEKGVKILPVDSEHSAIFQCLQGAGPNKIDNIYLTASGGPFRGYTKEQLQKATKADALKHPNWDMGNKVTIDSATLMNKGLEVIEAKYLFDVEPSQIKVAVHPQSIVHSMISFDDGAVIAQMGVPDMKLPIAYALDYPNRVANSSKKLNLFKEGANLTFEEADTSVFKCLGFAYDALREGHSYQIVLNGANEVLVSMFLKDEIRFLDIPSTIEKILNAHKALPVNSWEDVLAIDDEARELTRKMAKKI